MSPNVIPAKQPVKISQVHPPPVIAGLDPAIQSFEITRFPDPRVKSVDDKGRAKRVIQTTRALSGQADRDRSSGEECPRPPTPILAPTKVDRS